MSDRSTVGLFIIIVALILGTAVPGFIAYKDGVFFPSQVREKIINLGKSASLESSLANATKLLSDYEIKKKEKEDLLNKINETIKYTPVTSPVFPNLLKNNLDLEHEINSLKIPVQLDSFLSRRTNQFYYPLFFVILGWLVFILNPRNLKTTCKCCRLYVLGVIIGVFIYATWQFPHWCRNFLDGEDLRKVFTYTNWDISHWGWLYQEFEILLIGLLLGIIWRQWMLFYEERNKVLTEETQMGHINPLDSYKITRISETFEQWQCASLALALFLIMAFLFYWHNIVKQGDVRYLLSAVLIYLINLVTWAIISMPLIKTWREWNSQRWTFIQVTLYSSLSYDDKRLLIDATNNAHPVSILSVLLSGAVTIISITLPIIEMLIK